MLSLEPLDLSPWGLTKTAILTWDFLVLAVSTVPSRGGLRYVSLEDPRPLRTGCQKVIRITDVRLTALSASFKEGMSGNLQINSSMIFCLFLFYH